MKRALSILLAVLMLASLCSSMGFADDVVAEEAPSTGEYVETEAAYVEAADAYVEEYTEEDEGSFEAADAFTPVDIHYYIVNDGYVIDRVETTSGEYIGTLEADIPTKHAAECYVWLKKDLGNGIYGNPEKYYVIVPHEWGDWVSVPDEEASCTTGGWIHEERKCKGYKDANGNYDGKCDAVEVTEGHYLPMQEHTYVQDKTYTGGQYGKDDRAIVKKPTCKEDGLGHWVCIICGAPAPDTFRLGGIWRTGDYVIERKANDGSKYDPALDDGTNPAKALNPIYHDWGDWTVVKPATCSVNGTEAHYCNLCNFQQTREILAFHHTINQKDAMKFDHIERLDCYHYAEVWVCSNPACYTKFDANDNEVATSTPSQLTKYVYKTDGTYATTLEKAMTNKNAAFLYTTKYTTTFGKNNTEYYEHHHYGTDWELTTPPKCTVQGEWSRKCTECGDITVKPEPALEPIYGEIVHTDYQLVNNKRVYFHWVCCTRTDCQAANAAPQFGKVTNDPTNAKYFTQENVVNQYQVMLVDHNWSDWTCYVKPVEGSTKGHWTRTCLYTETTNANGQLENCLANEEFVGTQAEFDAMVNPPHPVLKTGIYKEDGAFKLYEMGMFDADFTGIFDGYNDVLGQTGKWYVKNGIWKNNAMGATLVGSTWYFLANGKVQEVTQLAEYQGKWFYVVNGVIDTTKTALVDYNGGKFVVAKGRIVDEYNGLWQNAKSIGGDDSWYYVANGQVQTQYTGLVLYDGEWFYVENGQLVPYNGEVEYDGEIFNVKEGMVVAA